MTTFFGRTAELESLDELFLRGQRLITLAGAGGMGKTRLARRYAEVFGQRYAREKSGGVWFCDLTEVRTLVELCGVVSQTFGLVLPRGEPGDVVQLGEVLAARRGVLLILDNCEQVIEPAAEALRSWYSSANEAHFLLTSREPTRLAAERVLEVTSLPLSESVQLFVERARSVRRDYQLRDEEAPRVAAIVRRLDGMPLAIELAAARMKVLGTRDVIERLSQRFELLTGAPRDTSARQQTLRDTIRWSWDLLRPWEQAALRQCSVFSGGFALSAASAVIDVTAFDDPPPTLDILQSLVEKSLLRTYEPASFPGELRFGFYESIREFAADRLRVAGEAEAAFARHTRDTLALAAVLADGAARRGGVERLQRLSLEMENLRSVVARAANSTSAEAADHGMRATLAMSRVLSARGPLETYLHCLDQAIALSHSNGGDEALLASARALRARARMRRGLWLDGRADAQWVLDWAVRAGDRAAEAQALANIGWSDKMCGDLIAAERTYRRALDAARVAGNAEDEAFVLAGLGVVLAASFRVAEALEILQRSVDVSRSAGDRRAEGHALGFLAGALARARRLEEARTVLRQAATIAEEFGDAVEVAINQSNLGVVNQELGRMQEARQCFERSLDVYPPGVAPGGVAYAYGSLGRLHHELGDVAAARERTLQAIEVLGPLPASRTGYGAWFRAALAALDAQRDTEAAARAFDALEQSPRPEDPESAAIVSLYRGHLDLALRARHEDAGEPDDADRFRAQAQARIVLAQPVIDSDDVRVAIRLLQRRLDAPARVRSTAGQAATRGFTLHVGGGGRWFRVRDGARIDIDGRRSLRRILCALVEQRRACPGVPLAVDAILEVGWPGERMRAEAGSARVRTALSTLRRLGLRELVVSRSPGHLLDAHVEIVDEP